MDRMHIKRLLTICLALMLSVSMLPAGTFALAGTDAVLSQEQAGEETGSEDQQTDTSDVAASENPAETPEGEEVVTTPQPETDGDTADKVVEERPAKEPEAAAEAEQKAAFEFADYLTSDTGVLYLPEDAEEWAPADDNVKLDPAQKVLLHIAYEIPAGTVDKTNAETEYALPEGLTLSEDEIMAANKDGSVYEGKDRKAADLKKSGQFEIKDGKVRITFSDGALSENDPMTGFFEIEVSASDLLAFDKNGENTYRIRWNDDSSIDTVVVIGTENLTEEDQNVDSENKDTEDVSNNESTEKADVSSSDVLYKGAQATLLALAGVFPEAKNKIGLLAAPESDYTFDAFWDMQGVGSDPDSEFVLDEDNRLLTVTPKLSERRRSVKLMVSFDFNKRDETVIDAFAVKMKVPKNIFLNWEGTTYQVRDNYPWGWIADQYSVSSTPRSTGPNTAPATSGENDKFCYYIEGDYVVFTNFKPLDDNVQWSEDIEFTFTPKRIGEEDVDGDQITDYFQNTVTTDLYVNDEKKGSVDNDIIVDTDIVESSYEKRATAVGDGGYYATWQEAWGPKPSDSSKYFYYVWEVRVTPSGKDTQPYSITLSDTTNNNGEVVGLKSNDAQYYVGASASWLNGCADEGWQDNATLIRINETGFDVAPKFIRWMVLTRYPKTCLQYNAEKKEYYADLHNDAEITTTARSGRIEKSPAEADFRVTIPAGDPYAGAPTPITTVSKVLENLNGLVKPQMLNFDVPLLLGNQLGYDGPQSWKISVDALPNQSGDIWDSDAGTYHMDPYTLKVDEGQFFFHSTTTKTGFNCNNRLWEMVDPMELQRGDYEMISVSLELSEFDAEYIDLSNKWEVQTSERKQYNLYGKVDLYLDGSDTSCGYLTKNSNGGLDFTSLDPDIASVADVALDNKIKLPSGTYHIKAIYHNDESEHPAFYTVLRIEPDIRLLPSERVKARLQKDIDAELYGTVVTNVTHSYLYDKNGTLLDTGVNLKESPDGPDGGQNMRVSSYCLRGVTYNTNLEKLESKVTTFQNDAGAKLQKQRVTINAANIVSAPNEVFSDEYLHDYVLSSGTFYDLLPAGTSIENLQVLSEYAASTFHRIDYSLEYIQNYQGSGQTLMIVKYTLPEDKDKWPTGLKASTIRVTYTLVNPYVNIEDRGENTLNTVAYVNNDDLIKPNPSSQIDSIIKGDYYQDIEEENKGRTLYAQRTYIWDPITSHQGEMLKYVSTAEQPEYMKDNATFFDQSYTYRASYTIARAEARDIVFYDILESGSNSGSKGWQGSFESIDVSSLKEKAGADGSLCDPVVYYSTASFDSFEPSETEKDLTDTSRWTTEVPSDPSKVTAVAVDCRKTVDDTDFIFDNTSIISFYINMKAPSEPADEQWDGSKPAVNTMNLYSRISKNDPLVLLQSEASIKLETTRVDIEKIWKDDDNRDNIRPESVTVKLLKDGDEYDSVDLNESNEWKHSFLNLKKYDYSTGEQREIEYDIEEVKTDVVADEDTAATYKSVVEGDAENGFTITNTHTPVKTEISGTKIWNDGEGENRPESIEIIVTGMANGAKAVEETVKVIFEGEPGDGEVLAKEDAEGNWAFTVKGLNKLEKGVEIVYTIAEKTVDGYASKVEGDAETGFKITNTETTSVPVEKLWNDGDGENRPESIEVQLLANDEEVEGKTLTLNEGNEWKDEFTDLPKYDEDKALIVYTVSEVSVDGYSTETAGDAEDGFVITNTELTNIPVEKVWNDGDNADSTRAESIEVQLLAGDEAVEGKTLTLNEDNEWKDEFKDLPKYDENNELIVYTVSEVSVEGYSTEITGDADEGFVITNTELTEVSVKKVWDDADDKDGIRPKELKVALSNGTEDVAEETLNEANDWSATVKDIPKYDSSKEAIEYTWTEKDLPEGYELTDTSVEGTITTLTNTHVPDEDVPPSCEVRISKVNEKGKAISGAVFEVYRFEDGKEVKLTQSDYGWLDANGQFTVGKQPYLLSDLEDGRYEIKEVKAPEGYKIKDKWPVTFTVKDGKVDGSLNTLTSGVRYEKTGDGSALYTITNTSIPGKGVKTGDDTHIGLWLTLMLLTAGCLAGLLVYRRRRA